MASEEPSSKYKRTVIEDGTGIFFELEDAEGNKMRYRDYDGHKYPEDFPKNVKEHVEGMINMKCREDDIFVVTYPKAGIHWIVNIAGMLATGKTDFIGIPVFLDFQEDLSVLDKLESPRILASHLWFDRLPRELQQGKGRILNINRNFKDSMVSFYAFDDRSNPRMYDGTPEGFFNFYLDEEIGQDGWFQNIREWERMKKAHPDKAILYLQYEDMKRNFYENLVKMSKFLGMNHSEEFLREVEKKCSFKSMQKGAVVTSPYLGYEPNEGEFSIYRKGEIGDWKNWFTVAQNEAYDAIYREKMAGLDIEFTYE